MYVTAPLLTFTHVNYKFKLSTHLFSMEAMTCTTDEHLYKMLQTILQLSKSRLICATVARWLYLACDMTWSQKVCKSKFNLSKWCKKIPQLCREL